MFLREAGLLGILETVHCDIYILVGIVYIVFFPISLASEGLSSMVVLFKVADHSTAHVLDMLQFIELVFGGSLQE